MRVRAWVIARPGTLVGLIAGLAFLPGLLEMLRHGVPDVLLTGDGATLELRTLNAAHGKQWLGPYSRFLWGHPGPAMFYLALPFYEVLHQRGSALNVFAFASGLASSIALGLIAKALRGTFVALVITVLFGVYALVGAPYAMSSAWNPTVPMLPFALLVMLGVRLAVGKGTVAVLLGFVGVGSAVVQTHLAYAPAVVALGVVALIWSRARRLPRWLGRRGRLSAAPTTPSIAKERLPAWSLLAALGLFGLCWALPIEENVMVRPGNLSTLWSFFSSPHRAEHSWGVAWFQVFRQMAVMPLALGQVLGIAPGGELGWPAARLFGVSELALVSGAFTVAVLRKDEILAALAVVVTAVFFAALASIREIRDEIQPYLVVWTSTLGFLVAMVGTAWLGRSLPLTGSARARRAAFGIGGMALAFLAVAVASAFGRVQLFPERDPAVEDLARSVRRELAARKIERPIVHIDASSTWPAAFAVILYLAKNDIPVAVERSWLHMAGRPFAPGGQERYRLHFGDAAFHAEVKDRLDHAPLAGSSDVFADLEDTHYLQDHRVTADPGSVVAYDVVGDLASVTDGRIPEEGTVWDSPAAVVLTADSSAVEVATPPGDLVGVYLSADGNDVYGLRCVGEDGLQWLVGPKRPEQARSGIHTQLIFTTALRACRAIEVTPVSGDGAYSIAELGFLRR